MQQTVAQMVEHLTRAIRSWFQTPAGPDMSPSLLSHILFIEQ